MEIQNARNKKKFIWLFLLIFLKLYSQQSEVLVNINNSKFDKNSKIEYEVVNNTKKTVYWFVGMESLIDNEWRPFILDITTNPISKKAKILILRPNQKIKKNQIIEVLFPNDVDRFKQNDFRFVLNYKCKKKEKKWKYAYSKVFSLN